MGISGLLPLLKSIHKHTTLKSFAGQTIGIDGYGWLHRGAIACAVELALDRPTTKYIEFAVNRVRMLLDFGITPYVVFDGDALPSKAGTNQERRSRREEAKRLGLQLYKSGKTTQAYQELQKATAISHQMARQLVEELKRMNIRYVVAPYEADAQLAYLERKGIINGVLSEDSDLLVFGVARLITKLNQYGECVMIERKDFPLCKEVSLSGWSDTMFRHMAILSGCDYLPNIEKMGLKTAHRFVRKYKDIEKVVRMVAFEGKLSVPPGYLDKFRQAELTFLHHRVFCPLEQRMVFLTDLDRGMQEADMPYLGPYVEPEVAIGVACGDLNPRSKEPMSAQPVLLMRPSLKDTRRQTLGTPSELKQKISMDSFFKPQRTPLAELDPNSLTPSASQQRLLESNRNASWEPRPVQSAPQLRHTTNIVTSATSRGTDRRTFLTRASTMSAHQPLKRQRLCCEAGEGSPAKEPNQSRFFSAHDSQMSPLHQKRSRLRKAKNEFDVWSDDSVDGILIGLTDVQQHASPKLQQKGTQSPKQASSSFDCIPQSPDVKSSETSQSVKEVFSQNSSTSNEATSQESSKTALSFDEDPQAFEDLLEFHVQKQNARLSRTFSLQSPACQKRALHMLRPAGTVDSINGDDAPVATSTARGQKSTASSLWRTFAYQSSSAQTSALETMAARLKQVPESKTPTDSGRNMKSRRLRASTADDEDDLLPQMLAPRSHEGETAGSEDALVPTSDDYLSGVDDGAPFVGINLKQFAFEA